MLHQGTKRLESQRFILRPFQKDDRPKQCLNVGQVMKK